MKKALILKSNNQLCDVVNAEFAVTSDFEWVDCADEVAVGRFQYDGSNFIKNAEPTYSDQRAAAYPSIEDQLDKQYWDLVNGTTTWKDSIQAVKDQYPKSEAN